MSGIKLSDRTKYMINADSYENFITSELRNYNSKFTDPLTLCFKLMIDDTKPYGLLADSSNTNSALAYLKRIGQTERYEMLKQWIDIFKYYIKYYDFLILGCEGIDDIVGKKPGDMYNEENSKINIITRETSDMLCQSLITMYRHIWYDNERQVEVIPINLRRFDLSILIYSGGYYNMALYDTLENNTSLTEQNKYITKIYPTIKKLSEGYFKENSTYDFNHHLITIGDAQINTEESGKSFFSNISNEPSDEFIKNNFNFSYRFATYKGTFNNIFGEIDFVKVLSLAAAQDNVSNRMLSDYQKNSTSSSKSSYQQTVDKVSSNMKSYFTDTAKSLGKNASDFVKEVSSRPTTYLNKFIGVNTVIGNALSILSNGSTIPNMIKNTADLALSAVDNQIYSSMGKINNLVLSSYSDNFVSIYKNYLENESVPNKSKYEKVINNETSETVNKSKLTNIYNRNSF
jgi:hypothetical protein